MQDLLAACVELEELAVALYSRFIEDAEDQALVPVFETLCADEAEHLVWWADAKHRFDAGEIAGLEASEHVTSYVKAIVVTLRAMITGVHAVSLSDDDRLALASSLEFFALDPVFAALIRESDPVLGERRRDDYGEHVGMLIGAMEARRSWPLAPHIAMLKAASAPGPYSPGDAPHDALTGLPVRALAESAVDGLCDDPARDGEAISIAIVDVAPDALAHCEPRIAEQGLARVASTLTSLLRFTDLLASLGAGRYAVVFPATSSGSACAIADSLAQAASSVLASAGGDGRDVVVRTAVVTLLPGQGRCGGVAAFAEAEALLGEVGAAGELAGAREIG